MLDAIGNMAQNIAILLLLNGMWRQQKAMNTQQKAINTQQKAINTQQEMIRLVCKWQLKINRP